MRLSKSAVVHGTFLFLLFATGVNAFATGNKLRDSEIGVLVLAHGAGPEWNKAVEDAVIKVSGGHQKAVVFGMGDAASIQFGIDKLEAAGVKAMVVVPLFLSSHSEMYRNLEYVLGLRDEPDVLFWMLMTSGKENGHAVHRMDVMKQAKFSVPYNVRPPINYESLVRGILVERVRDALRGRENASVFLLAHGPISSEDNSVWLSDLHHYARRLSREFIGVKFFAHTFRDDAPFFIREPAIRVIQDELKREKNSGREVVVLPYLLAPGGREDEIKRITENCGCTIYAKTLLPHPSFSLWIEREIQTGLSRLR